MPRMKDDTIAEFLLEPHIGVLASLQGNGLPYTVPVWWLHDKGSFWLTGTFNRVWCKHLIARPGCSLCIEALAPVAGHVGIEATAELYQLPDVDIWPISRQLAEKYVGQDNPSNAQAVDKFFNNMKTEPRLLFKLTPTNWRAIDMRQYRGKKSDRKFQADQQR